MADGAEPDLRRGRELRAPFAAALARLKGDRYLRRAEDSPDDSVLDKADARGDLALGHASLAPAPDERCSSARRTSTR